MSTYAKATTVTPERSRLEIERLLQRYGATAFVYGWQGDKSMIAFQYGRFQIRLIVPMPDRNERQFTHHSRGKRESSAAQKRWEQACNQRWRAVALLIKAKLEGIESGITTFEDEFLTRHVLPDGQTVGEWFAPQIERIAEGSMPNLLPMLEIRGEMDAHPAGYDYDDIDQSGKYEDSI